MNKLAALILVFCVATGAYAAPSANDYERITSEIFTACNGKPQSACWSSLKTRLAQLGPPKTKQEFDDQVLAYWMLAKLAHALGEFADAQSLFEATRALTQKTDTFGIRDDAHDYAALILEADMAELAISAGNHAQALAYLDRIASASPETMATPPIQLLRCAALIGLKRDGLANTCLQALLAGLDFSGASPSCGLPFLLGPAPTNPYQIGRRIAAYYARQGKAEQAFDLLHLLAGKRQSAISVMAKDRPDRLWATELSAADLLEDEAAVFVSQGSDMQADASLRRAIEIREQELSPTRKRDLIQLANIGRRMGQFNEAASLQARADALKAEPVDAAPRPRLVDPLAATLGMFE
ncbi:MAG: hypothetical protein V4582_15835 [Pseudomonadota bacterium]